MDKDIAQRTSVVTAAMRAVRIEQCRAALTALPAGCAFSHLTAAWIHGLPMSYAMEEDTRVHVTRPIGKGQIRREDFVGHRVLHPREMVEIEGLPVVGLADTWADLGEVVGRGKPVGLDDLMVVGDAVSTMIGRVQPLGAAMLGRIRPRGKNTLAEALPLIRVGARSPRETLTRVVFVRCGLPEPALNQAIVSSRDAKPLLGVADMAWEFEGPDGTAIKLVGEYQGREFHSSDEQRNITEERRADFEADGWAFEEVWNCDHADATARSAMVIRFARRLSIPVDGLDLGQVEPHFFSRHAIDLAIQRQNRRMWRDVGGDRGRWQQRA